MKFIPDHSAITSKWTEMTYYENINSVKPNFISKANPLETLYSHTRMFRKQIAAMTFGVTNASKYWHMEKEFSELISSMWSVVNMMNIPENPDDSDTVLDMYNFETLLRTIYDINHHVSFGTARGCENMPVFVTGIRMSIKSVLTTLGHIQDSMKIITELIIEFTEQEAVAA